MSRRRLVGGVAFAAAAYLASGPVLLGQRPRESPELTAIVSRTAKTLDAFWLDQIFNFKTPTVVAAYVPEDPSEPCGPTGADNAYYCSQTGGVYYDVGYLEKWRTSIGDYGAITTLAHEWGHRVQDHFGLLRARAGLFSIQSEMMADCLSGAYLRSVNQRTPLSEDARRQITLKLAAVGDRRSPWHHPQAHGRAGQRIDAFNEGMEGRACTSEDFFRTLGIDRDALQLAPPGRGSVRERIPQHVGRFELAGSGFVPDLITNGAIETLVAVYRGAKVELTVTLKAFRSADRSAAHLDVRLRDLAREKLSEVRRSRVARSDGGSDLGVLVVLEGGAGEAVLWTNGTIFGSVVGPRDFVWEFVRAFL